MMDLLTEIYVSMSRNKLRIALTGFSIAWGIFLLIVMLSAGNGFLNAMAENFSSNMTNSIRVYPGWTSEPFEGLPRDRYIKLDENIKRLLDSRFHDQIIESIPRISKSSLVSHGEFSTNLSLINYNVGDAEKENIQIAKGRDINVMDIREIRKVLLISKDSEELLFGKNADAVGKWVNVGEIPFLVIGVYKTSEVQQSGPAYMPTTTISLIFNPNKTFSYLTLITDRLETAEANEQFDKDIQEAVAEYRRYDKDDYGVWVRNSYEQFLQIKQVMNGLNIFIWIIGIASLIAGIVGVSNIMLITVRERTREFGIRKALGASPRSILVLVLLEAVGITMLFGYIGMIIGLGLVKLITEIAYSMSPEAQEIFHNPTVPVGIVLGATLTMVIAGMIAGFIPAKRAVSIKPVEALATL